MKVFDSIKSKNIDELAEWLNKYGVQDYSPWDNWFYNKYCSECDPIEKTDGIYENEYTWCELNCNKCKYFQSMKEAPWGKQLVKMWLESEDTDGV